MASLTAEAPSMDVKIAEPDDSLSSYRRLCEVRMRRLERYKKAKSFCNLDDENNFSCASTERCSQQATRMSMPSPQTPSPVQTPDDPNLTFEELKSKMVSLMENDVILFREMLTIADTLQELKMSREEAVKNAARSNSQSSLSDDDDEEDDLYICDGGRPFSSSMPGITRLYVDDEPNPSSNVQFFSRKNSVLRIPIPPRSSNRMNSTRRIPRRPSELMTRPPRLLHIDDTASSASQSPQQSPQSDSDQKSRRSSGSIDSGIRDGDDSACSLSSSDSLPSRHRNKLI
ncbi:hypothetical protein QR680_000186 [Steinernema hermaphroditum]|uniref:Uncharacterized protein n=1 Tax=Steinernema hermaphroditum TaxID=289476 RepID=A0AA39GTP2_9BILA|nr:hypothetical protein QR680_000186 [Steinernema hermaphroditum]